MQGIASRLQNRVEIWKREKISTKLGDSYEPKFFKKVWADVIPLSANTAQGEAETEKVKTKFKILMRENNISNSDFIMYKNLKLEVEYTLPQFDRKGYIEVYALLVKE